MQEKFKKSFIYRISKKAAPRRDKREPRCNQWIGDKREPILLLPLRDMRVQFGLGPAPLILSIPTTYTAALRANTDPPGPFIICLVDQVFI
jgi:hypothetical protein